MEDETPFSRKRETVHVSSDDCIEHVDDIYEEDSDQSSESNEDMVVELFDLISQIKKKNEKKESLEQLLRLVRTENIKKQMIDFVSFYLLEILLSRIEYRFLIIDILLEVFRDGINYGKVYERLLQALTSKRILFLLTDTLYITRDLRIISFITMLVQTDTLMDQSKEKDIIRTLTELHFFHMCAALPSFESCEMFELIFSKNIFIMEDKKSRIIRHMLKIVGDAYLDFEDEIEPHAFNGSRSATTIISNDQSSTIKHGNPENTISGHTHPQNHTFSASYDVNFTQNTLHDDKTAISLKESSLGDRDPCSSETSTIGHRKSSQTTNGPTKQDDSQPLINTMPEHIGVLNSGVLDSESQYESIDLAPSGLSEMIGLGLCSEAHSSLSSSQTSKFQIVDTQSGSPSKIKTIKAHEHNEIETISDSLDLVPSGYDFLDHKENKINKYGGDIHELGSIPGDNAKSLDILSHPDKKNEHPIKSPPTTLVSDAVTNEVKNISNKPVDAPKKRPLVRKMTVPYPHETNRPLFPSRITIREKIDLFPHRTFQKTNLRNKKAGSSENSTTQDQTPEYNNESDCLTVLICVFLSNYTNFISYRPIFSLNTVLRLNNFLGSNILNREISIFLKNMANNIVQWLKDYTAKMESLREGQKTKGKKISDLVPTPQVLQRLSRLTLANSGFQSFLKEKYHRNGHSIFIHHPDLIHSKFWTDKIILYLSRKCVHFNSECNNYQNSEAEIQKSTNILDSSKNTDQSCRCFLNCEKWASLVVLTHQTVPYKMSTMVVIFKLYRSLKNNHKFVQENQDDNEISQIKILDWLYAWLDSALNYLKTSHMNWARMIFGFDSFNHAQLLQEKRDQEILSDYYKENDRTDEMRQIRKLVLFDSDESHENKRNRQIIDSESDDQGIIPSGAFSIGDGKT